MNNELNAFYSGKEIEWISEWIKWINNDGYNE